MSKGFYCAKQRVRYWQYFGWRVRISGGLHLRKGFKIFLKEDDAGVEHPDGIGFGGEVGENYRVFLAIYLS